MDIMETFTVDVTGGHWGLPVGAIAICAAVITLICDGSISGCGKFAR